MPIALGAAAIALCAVDHPHLPVRDFDESTLWRISAYERERAQSGHSGFASLHTLLPEALLTRLRAVERIAPPHEVMEVVAACMRQRDSVLLLLRHQDLVWPLNLFPMAGAYHSPHDIVPTLKPGLRAMQVVALEPPGLRPPRPGALEEVAYRPLAPLLWALALSVPGGQLLHDISGRAAYRASASVGTGGVALAGALTSALRRLGQGCSSLHDIAGWPGMDRERAARLLNGLYLQGSLITLRSHPAARDSAALTPKPRR